MKKLVFILVFIVCLRASDNELNEIVEETVRRCLHDVALVQMLHRALSNDQELLNRVSSDQPRIFDNHLSDSPVSDEDNERSICSNPKCQSAPVEMSRDFYIQNRASIRQRRFSCSSSDISSGSDADDESDRPSRMSTKSASPKVHRRVLPNSTYLIQVHEEVSQPDIPGSEEPYDNTREHEVGSATEELLRECFEHVDKDPKSSSE